MSSMSSIERALAKKAQQKKRSTNTPDRLADADQQTGNVHDRFYIDDDTPARQVELNLAQLGGNGLPTLDTSTQLSEEYRIMKQPILKNAFDSRASYIDHRNLVMVTSALPGEGKTFTAINLAISIAKELDKTVLLVDADFARSGVSKALNFDPGVGLSDLLTDNNLVLQDMLIKTSIPKLSILSSGSAKSNITELVASEYMASLASELSNRYPERIVIFDSPPLLVTSEARVLSGMMGQVLVVVESESTPQKVVEDAVQLLDSSKAIGFALNKAQRHIGSSYGYGYGYGYNYGGKDKK